MSVLTSLPGNASGNVFLFAPLGTTHDAKITLRTNAAAESFRLKASSFKRRGTPARLVFSLTNLNFSTTPRVVTVHVTGQSAWRGEPSIEVFHGATVEANFTGATYNRNGSNQRPGP